VDILAEKYDYCGRFNGGANAGHTVVVNGKKYAFHLLPCGILYSNCKNILGNGVVVHIPTMFDELKQLDRDHVNYDGRLFVSDRAHLVLDVHAAADGAREKATSGGGESPFLGTTKRGIGPTYASKANRIGLRAGDLKYWDTFVSKYKLIQKKYKESEGVTVDTEAELKVLKGYRDYMFGKNMIIDHIPIIN